MAKVEVKQARNGMGLFAKMSVQDHGVILEIRGKRAYYATLFKVGGTYQNNCIRYSEWYYLAPHGSIGEYINHSCEPNCRIDKRGGKLYLIAIRNIEKSEELTFDYSTLTASDDIWTMTCNCGTKACRGVVKKYTTLPKDLRNEYIQKNIIPQYILNI